MCVERVGNSFSTGLYRKPTFSEVYSNYESFMESSYKSGLVKCLLYRAFRLCSTWEKFHVEITKLKEIMSKNCYPHTMIDSIVTGFINKVVHVNFMPPVKPKVEKVYLVVPYLGHVSLQLRTRLMRLCRAGYPKIHFCVVFKTACRISHFFKFKDKLCNDLRSMVVYKYKCGTCNGSYIGKTYRHFHHRVSEHRGVSHLTGSEMGAPPYSSIRKHSLDEGHAIDLKGFSIVTSAHCNYVLELKESLCISKDKPEINVKDKDRCKVLRLF